MTPPERGQPKPKQCTSSIIIGSPWLLPPGCFERARVQSVLRGSRLPSMPRAGQTTPSARASGAHQGADVHGVGVVGGHVDHGGNHLVAGLDLVGPGWRCHCTSPRSGLHRESLWMTVDESREWPSSGRTVIFSGDVCHDVLRGCDAQRHMRLADSLSLA
jgi:hypothetical protein